jgi:hypothetical protein
MPVSQRWVDEIHSRLLIRYGREWVNLYPGIDPEMVKADWAQALDNMPAYRIKHALENLPDAVPNVVKFRDLCLKAPDQGLPMVGYDAKANPEVVRAVMQGMKPKERDDGKNWARSLLRRANAGERLNPVQMRFAREALQGAGDGSD